MYDRRAAGGAFSASERSHLIQRGRPMSTNTAPAALSAEQMSEMLALTKHADTVELKLTVPETKSGYRSTVQALDIDALDAQLRQVFFLDTPDLALNEHGLV